MSAQPSHLAAITRRTDMSPAVDGLPRADGVPADDAPADDGPAPAWLPYAVAGALGLVLAIALYGWGRYAALISMDWVTMLCG
ncbi:hypothetical protein P7L78_13410 [Tistrella bauzanensis]|jgi:hypothetical protein|uniref:Uncharacterized protein n=1 Tax=Tistrella arctica TaxID=3133430 RepID=A0ABU9YHW0_9PROT